jgi:hypothetical protein
VHDAVHDGDDDHAGHGHGHRFWKTSRKKSMTRPCHGDLVLSFLLLS